MDGKSITSGEKVSQPRKRRSRLNKDKFKKRKRTRSSSSESSSQEKKPHKKKKGGAKRKRKQPSSSDDSSSSSSSVSSSSSFTTSSSSEEERKKKIMKRKKKRKHTKSNIKSKAAKVEAEEQGNLDIPIDFMDKSRSMAPMTKEEWEKKQSVVRRIYDESTGRHRLIKGDGEVVEEIVSRDRHKAINQQATKGDGEFFQTRVNSSVKK